MQPSSVQPSALPHLKASKSTGTSSAELWVVEAGRCRCGDEGIVYIPLKKVWRTIWRSILCFFFSFSFFFRVPSYGCQKLIGGCWLFFTRCASVCISVCVCVCLCARVFCMCDCSRKCRLKKGRWRQMGEVGGRCSQKTWKSTPPPPPLTRPHALLARLRVKITQFALSQVTEMQSSRD